MAYRAIPATLLCLCVSLPAAAADVAFFMGGDVEYDNNVFRTERDTEDDVFFRLRPGVRLYEEHGDDLNYSLRYQAPVELPVDHFDELWDTDQIADGNFEYHINDQLQFFGTDRFGYLRSTLRNVRSNNDAAGIGQPTINDNRDRVTQNEASLGLSYAFDPRLTGRFVVNTDYYDPTRDDRSKVYSIGSTLDTVYALTERHQVGGGFTYNFQDFSDRVDIQGSRTNTYNLFASWRWTIDETLSIGVRAGPSYLTTEQSNSNEFTSVNSVNLIALKPGSPVAGYFNSTGGLITNPTAQSAPGDVLVPSFANQFNQPNCAAVNGQFVAICNFNVYLTGADAADAVSQQTTVTNVDANGDTDSQINIFVEATVSKQWSPTLATGLSYTRQQGNASGLGGTVIVDAVTLANTWDFMERWQLALRGDWVRRVSAFDIQQTYDVVAGTYVPPGGTVILAERTGVAFNSKQGAEIDTNRWSVAARVTHQLFKRTSVYAQVRYDEQNSKSDSLASTSDFTDLLATFGVLYTFEPITLW
jgi:predicted porin